MYESRESTIVDAPVEGSAKRRIGKTTKGALAAAAAAALLLGGAGSLAYWSDSQNAPGTDISSGHLSLGAISCDGWKLTGASLLNPVNYVSQLIVPGDQLKQHCTLTIDAAGANIGVNLSTNSPTYTLSNGLSSTLQTAATYKKNGSAFGGSGAVSNGDVIDTTITVTFPTVGSLPNTQSLSNTLNAITISAAQTNVG
ncbi:MAG TPA: alternate-type signal peptide domain-containing protein [Aeromicrobium sp.]|nr:alternate-type signal peptide domain-containing protein [Aeromicrobium sp.]